MGVGEVGGGGGWARGDGWKGRRRDGLPDDEVACLHGTRKNMLANGCIG